MFIKSKYTAWYFSIINNAQSRGSSDAEYYELHHIIPKSMGGTNDADNLVKLTAREHFLCHLLLVKAVSSEFKKKMNFAYWRMCNATGNRHTPTSRQYELGRTLFKDALQGHPSYLASHSEETKKKISSTVKSKLAKLTDNERRNRVLNSCCKPESYTSERAQKISKATTGVKKTMTPKAVSALESTKESRIARLKECGANNKGRTWKLIDGKRVWMDKE